PFNNLLRCSRLRRDGGVNGPAISNMPAGVPIKFDRPLQIEHFRVYPAFAVLVEFGCIGAESDPFINGKKTSILPTELGLQLLDIGLVEHAAHYLKGTTSLNLYRQQRIDQRH